MSPCGTNEAFRCCHGLLVFFNVFTPFSYFSCVLDINVFSVDHAKVNIYMQLVLFAFFDYFLKFHLFFNTIFSWC